MLIRIEEGNNQPSKTKNVGSFVILLPSFLLQCLASKKGEIFSETAYIHLLFVCCCIFNWWLMKRSFYKILPSSWWFELELKGHRPVIFSKCRKCEYTRPCSFNSSIGQIFATKQMKIRFSLITEFTKLCLLQQQASLLFVALIWQKVRIVVDDVVT